VVPANPLRALPPVASRHDSNTRLKRPRHDSLSDDDDDHVPPSDDPSRPPVKLRIRRFAAGKNADYGGHIATFQLAVEADNPILPKSLVREIKRRKAANWLLPQNPTRRDLPDDHPLKSFRPQYKYPEHAPHVAAMWGLAEHPIESAARGEHVYSSGRLTCSTKEDIALFSSLSSFRKSAASS
jgi:hypothetical protein